MKTEKKNLRRISIVVTAQTKGNLERLAAVCAHVYYRMAGSDHADPELQAKIVRMAREHWRAALRVPNSKKREKSKLWMLICCPAAGRWMWRLGKKLKQG